MIKPLLAILLLAATAVSAQEQHYEAAFLSIPDSAGAAQSARAINERMENRTARLLAEMNSRMLRERVKNKKADRLVVICLTTP